MLRLDWRRLTAVLPHGNRMLVSLTVVSFLSGILEAAVLVLVVLAALGVTEGNDTITLPVIGAEVSPGVGLALAAGATLVSLAAHVHTARMTSSMASKVAFSVRSQAVHAFSRASWARQARDREGALQETVTTLTQQTSQLSLNFTNLLAAAASLLALYLTSFAVDPVVTVVVVVFAGFIFLLLRPLTGLTRRAATLWVKRNRIFAEQIAGWTSMVMDLRIFGVEQVKVDELMTVTRDVEAAMYRSRLANRVGSSLYKDLAILCLVGAVAALNTASSTDLAAVGPVVLLVVRSLNYAQQAQSSLQTTNELAPGLEAFLEKVASLEADVEEFGDQHVQRIGAIELRDVGYDYEPGRVGIAGISLTIEAGEALGIIGPSGGGKSTLAQVLLRLRPPTSGTVTVGGTPYEELAPADWHGLVSLVPQEPHLIEGTVAENIAFFRWWIDDSAIEAAAAAAHVLDDIRRLPDGMDTMLGPRGSGVSGGQKQRIAIARALAGRPGLLVLDEPSSALDARSERLLQETIRELTGQVTLVIVAHRLTTLQSCDRILVLEHGRAQQLGPRDEVLATAPFLAGLDVGVDAEDATPAGLRNGEPWPA